jgi:glycerophosphoryl diester phosphodiesterase
MNTLFLWAHRGASGFAPENTLAAFRLAERLGAPALELDVHLTADGVPVVLHDDSLDRTTDGRGQVQRLSLAAVRAVDAGRWFAPAFAGERVPSPFTPTLTASAPGLSQRPARPG